MAELTTKQQSACHSTIDIIITEKLKFFSCRVRDHFLKKNSGNADFEHQRRGDRGTEGEHGPTPLTPIPTGEGLCPLHLSLKKNLFWISN